MYTPSTFYMKSAVLYLSFSGTDSPFRETSNIYDGSAVTADMAVQNCIGIQL